MNHLHNFNYHVKNISGKDSFVSIRKRAAFFSRHVLKQTTHPDFHPSKEIRSQLENCLSDGSPLLVTDCDLDALMKDKRFTDTIQNCVNFINGKTRFKVIVSKIPYEKNPKLLEYKLISMQIVRSITDF